MKRIKRILVPVDFSPHASEALRFAVDLSLKYQASLTILHVNELAWVMSPYAPLPADMIQSWVSEAQNLLRNTEREAKDEGATEVETAFLDGRPFSEIVRFAGDGNFDLIVMGTQGRGGMSHALLGSVAERVVRKAPCPVLTVGVRLSPAKQE